MRTNNAKARNIIISLYLILVILAVIITTMISSFSEFYTSPATSILIILLVFSVLFIITHSISKYFEYDSDGVQVVIINRGLLLSDYINYREHKIEFNKEKLAAFKFRNYIVFKSLTVYIKNSRGHKKKETFNVTFVNRKKRKYIKQSLSKMIKSNRKSKEESINV